MADLPPVPPIPIPPVPAVGKSNVTEDKPMQEVFEANEQLDENWRPKSRRPSVRNDVPLGNKPGEKVTRSDLSRLLGVSQSTIREWRNMGMPSEPKPKGKGDLYDVGQVMKWRVQHEHNLVKASMLDARPMIENQMSAIEADRREKAAKAQMAELKLARERELVANIDDIIENVADALTGVRAGLMALKSSLPGRLAHKDERFIEKALDKETRNLLEKLSDYAHEYRERDNELSD